jgi:uncharacterized protein
VQGGSRNYVAKVLAKLPDVRIGQVVTQVLRDTRGVTVQTAQGAERFDAIVLACHSDQALALLTPTTDEQRLLGAIGYQQNTAVLHTDASVLPSQRRAWAAWNYETHQSSLSSQSSTTGQQVCLHYLLNKLQPLPVGDEHPVIVSLNPLPEHRPQASAVIRQFNYAHPVFNSAAIAAQAQLASIQGKHHTWFAGAWTHYGFHEDGFQSGKAAAQGVIQAA